MPGSAMPSSIRRPDLIKAALALGLTPENVHSFAYRPDTLVVEAFEEDPNGGRKRERDESGTIRSVKTIHRIPVL